MSAVEVVETREIPLDDLAPFPGNARRGNLNKIRESVRVHGQYRSIVVRETPWDGLVILAGNHTAEAMKAEGHTTARCDVIRCDDQTALTINLVDNRAGDAGGYDDDALIAQLQALQEFEGSGYDQGDLDDLLMVLAPPSLDDLAKEVGEPEDDDLWPVLRFKVPANARAAFYQITDDAPDHDDTGRFLFILERAGWDKM